MALRAGGAEHFYRHEGWASSIPFVAWSFFGSFLVKDGAVQDAVLAGLLAVTALRALCWRTASWARYLGIEGTPGEGTAVIGSLDFELPALTMPERLSLWLIPIGYLFSWSIGMEAIVAHAFAAGIAGAIATGVLYRRVRNVESLIRTTGD